MDDNFTQALLTEFIRRLRIYDKEFGTYYSYYLDAQFDLKILAQLLGQSISHVQTKMPPTKTDQLTMTHSTGILNSLEQGAGAREVALAAYDQNYEEWKTGDLICWVEDKTRLWPIQSIYKTEIHWTAEDGNHQWTRCYNVYRVQEKREAQ